uniref:BTB domain-containing protein n=1 Tax=Mycena chlorophos TaxID=658473 RepID=A0ABQ0LQI5_MYCCL|nr:predicted protein [Mycena chlorophos]
MSTNPKSPKKRKTAPRDEDDGDGDERVADRQGNPWYEDGKVTIRAGEVEFRVYGGLLKDRSEILKAELEKKSDRSRMINLRLDDSAEDVSAFLKMIFRPHDYPPDGQDAYFEMASACFRLGRKYQVPAVARFGLFSILRAFSASDYRTFGRGILNPTPRIALEAIALVDSHYLPRIVLPRAYWTVLANMDEMSQDNLSTLPPQHLARLLLTAVPLRTAYLQECLGWCDEDPAQHNRSCSKPDSCMVAKRRIREEGAPAGRHEAYEIYHLKFCDQCESVYHPVFSAGWERLWAKLPRMFGLPEWKELEQEAETVTKVPYNKI